MKLLNIFTIVEITNIGIFFHYFTIKNHLPGLSFIINGILLLAVVRNSKVFSCDIRIVMILLQDLGNYRYLLLAFTLNGIYFPLVHSLTLPVRFPQFCSELSLRADYLLIRRRVHHVFSWLSWFQGFWIPCYLWLSLLYSSLCASSPLRTPKLCPSWRICSSTVW